MRVAYLMGSLNRGGTETLVLDICNTIKTTNIDLILLHRQEGQLTQNFHDSSVPLYQLTPNSLFDLNYLLKLRRLLLKEEIQIVHSHQTIDAISVFFATIGTPIKNVLSFHGHGIGENRLTYVLRRLVIRLVDRIVFVSHSQKQYFLDLFKSINHSEVLPNGIDFKKLEVKESMHIGSSIGLMPDELLLGSVGNFTSGRDQMTICRFLHLLKNRAVPFKFVFIGASSPAEPHLYNNCVEFCEQNELTNSVFFLGSQENVPLILQELDAFVYSTVHDTFGIAVIEAIATGIPVFVNDWVVMKEITEEGKFSTIYETKNEQDLLSKFEYFLANYDAFVEKAVKNAFLIQNKYSIQNHVVALKKIYNSLSTK